MVLFFVLAIISVYIAPIIVPALWIKVIILAVKRRRIPEEDVEQREKNGNSLKKYLITASVMTVCLIALVIWFGAAMAHM